MNIAPIIGIALVVGWLAGTGWLLPAIAVIVKVGVWLIPCVLLAIPLARAATRLTEK